ncbi:MAG: hypothetical protein DWQ35_20810 [Planctomycetota bacterium]|nr:MAG: hypothetical protein DWQ35_20810 [Planctomycetota bacterium]REK26457.1 MAG: hypothetical protein DWQ42_09020 [Planctomycetota bacterium]REK38706.1 MAG: hypothetical protein DWQ46_19955 [Planctomycetota bacterium]
MTETEYELADTYVGLREQALGLEGDAIDHVDVDKSEIIALLMETGYPEAIASLVVVADGTTSLYFSNGGGIIGAGEHEAVRDASKAFLSSGAEYRTRATRVESFPPPKRDHVRFYFVTGNAIYSTEALENDLGNDRHDFSELFFHGHAVISAMQQ